MEENKDYHAYRYGDHLTPGSELKIEHSVVCENVDISTLITMGIDSLEAMRQGSIDGEQKAYEIVVAAAKQWEQQAAATQTINRALEYLRTPEIEHTGNQWKDTDNWRADQKISNRVYQMTCSIWEDTKYDRETKQSVPIAWYVTWEVRIHSPKQGYGAKIAGQNQKRYTDKNAAIKYLDGRKKAYSHLFTEISPPIPKEYEHHFMVHGTLLPGYTVEGLEQAKTEHAAAEVSEGGIFTPENQEKPSVLGKLSVAKTQEKTPTTPGTAMKKKEDLYLPMWGNALCADRKELDVLGVGAYDGEKLVGLAACSADCDNMWQIGVDVLPEYRRMGIASSLTSNLAIEIIERGKVPFYCCAWSNLKSVKNALRSGFVPGWVEMTVKAASLVDEMNK